MFLSNKFCKKIIPPLFIKTPNDMTMVPFFSDFYFIFEKICFETHGEHQPKLLFHFYFVKIYVHMKNCACYNLYSRFLK